MTMQETPISDSEIFRAFQDCKASRIAHGFNMPGFRAIEDTAMMFDLSPRLVCEALSRVESTEN